MKLRDIIKNKKTTIITTEESLEEIEYIEWSDEVISGEKKVEIKELNDK